MKKRLPSHASVDGGQRVGRSGLFTLDKIDLNATVIGGVQHFMTLFGAKMRDVDNGCRIIRAHFQNLSGCHLAQPLGRLQNGQGTYKPGRIKGFISYHGTFAKRDVTVCPLRFERLCRDADLKTA